MESHLTIDRRLASHRDRYEPPESPPNTLLLAYEDRRFNKMARQLKDSHDELKSKILVELIQDLVNGNKIVLAAMTSEMIEVLVEHLEYSNDEIREMASKAIAQFCKIMKPREIVFVNKYPVEIKKRIDDHVEEIRENAYVAMLAMSRMIEGATTLIDIDMVETLVDKLEKEKSENILLLVQELLRQLLLVEGGTSRAVAIEELTIERLCFFIHSKNSLLREATLKNLYSFSFDYRGKELMIKRDCVARMLPILKDSELPVRAAAALVLASLVQFNEAKHQIIDNNHFADIMRMLETEKDDELLVNLIQLVTSLAEDNSRGRKEAHSALPQLQIFAKNKQSMLSQYALDAIEVITWKP
jgi:HEAT repeat protein